MGLNLPQQVKYILDKLNNAGYEAYVVGGCVRDSIIGLKPHDWDICTSALPEQTIELFKDNKIILTGMQHGTITIMIDSESYEITTFRIDGEYDDNRHPNNVEFVSSLRLDLMRRDFTINAMAYNEKVGMVDLFGGVNDLTDRIIRCVGNPNDRFEEDALRMMRAIRFAERFNCEIEDKTYNSILSHKKLIKNISAERINSEITRTLDYPNVLKSEKLIRCLFELLKEVIPEMKFINFSNMYCHLSKSNLVLNLRLALFFDTPEIEIIMKKLKFSNDEIHDVTEIRHYGYKLFDMTCSYYRFETELSYRHIARFLLKEASYDNLIYAIQFAKLLNSNQEEHILSALCNFDFAIVESYSKRDVYNLSRLNITGNDLINLGFKGKQIGEVLNKLLENVMFDYIKNNKEDLLNYIQGQTNEQKQ